MRRYYLLGAFLVLAACATAPVNLRHPGTGQTAQCGPYPGYTGAEQAASVAREARCISDFQRQGYERVSGP